MRLLLLVACTAAKPDSNTSADTVDTSPGTDSTESGSESDASDSTHDSGHSGDTGPPPTLWGPGDEIPGWPDAECPAPIPGLTARIDWPSLFLLEARFLDGVAAPGPQFLTVQLRDCLNFSCDAASLSRTDPYLEGLLDAGGSPDGEARGQGFYGAADGRSMVGDGLGITGAWSNREEGEYATATTCLYRVRPDEVRGVVWAEFPVPASFPTEDFGETSMFFAYPFDVVLPAHAGFDTNRPDSGDAPSGYAQAHFLYDTPYDTAWPWDDIADPGVAAAVYERYTPYNSP